MPTEIFHSSEGTEQHRLVLEDDGQTMTYWTSGTYLPTNRTSETLTVEQARQRFPQYAAVIDDALANRTY